MIELKHINKIYNGFNALMISVSLSRMVKSTASSDNQALGNLRSSAA